MLFLAQVFLKQRIKIFRCFLIDLSLIRQYKIDTATELLSSFHNPKIYDYEPFANKPVF